MPVYTIETPSGQKLDIEAADQATALRGAQEWHTQNAPQSGVMAGLKQGIAETASGDSQSSHQLLGTDGSTGQGIADAIAPKNYQSPPILGPNSHWYDPTSYNWSAVPQKFAEAAPGVAQDLAIGRTAGAVAGPEAGLLAGLGSFAWRSFGPEAKSAAVKRTGDPNAEPNDADKQHAALKVAAQTAIQGVGMRRFISTPVNRGLASTAANIGVTGVTEGGTGALANAAGQYIDTGTVDPNQVAEAGVGQGLGGTALAAPHAAGGLLDVAKYRNFDRPSAERVANRLQQNAGGKSLTNTDVGADALAKTGADINRELGDASKSLTTQLAPDHANILANAQKGMAPTDAQYGALEQALSSDPNGQAVLQLLKDKQTHSQLEDTGSLHNGKFIGGLARKIPELIGLSGHSVAKSVLAAAAVEHLGSHLIAMSPSSIGLAGAGWLGLRALDNITGARSPAARFVRQFGGDAGIRTPLQSPPPPPPPPPGPPVGPTGPKISGPPQPWAAQPQASAAPAPTGFADQIKDVQGLMAARRANAALTAQQADPLLKQLAQTGKPVDLPNNFAGMLSNPGAAAQAAPAAPAPAPQINPLMLPREITGPAKNLMAGSLAAQKLREAALGQQQAQAEVNASPYIEQKVGGAQNVPDPATAKVMKQALSGANALAKLRSDPEAAAEEAAAQKEEAAQVKSEAKAAATAARAQVKITKANGKVKTNGSAFPMNGHDSMDDVLAGSRMQREAYAAAEAKVKNGQMGEAFKDLPPPPPPPVFTPLKLKYKGMTDAQVAQAELSAKIADGAQVKYPEKYAGNVVKARQARRNAMSDLADIHEADAPKMGELLDQLHEVRSRSAAMNAVEQYTRNMSDKARAAVKAKFNADFINSIWPK